MGEEVTADTVENEGLGNTFTNAATSFGQWFARPFIEYLDKAPKAQFAKSTNDKTPAEPVATVDLALFTAGVLPARKDTIQTPTTNKPAVIKTATNADSSYNTDHENFSQDNVLAQQNLIALGFTDLGHYGAHKDGVDGIDGPKTSEQLKLYQEEFGLEITGDVNAETLAHMEQLKLSKGVEYETPSTFDRTLNKAESLLSSAYHKARDFIAPDNRPIHERVVDSDLVRETSEWGEARVKKDGTPYKHGGIDLAGTKAGDQPDILAAEGGIVTRVDNHPNGFGQFVEISNGLDSKFSLIYAHLDEKSSLQEGKPVNAGELIGVMGKTGTSTGVHLHLEARYNGMKFDPKFYDQAVEQGYLSPEMMPNNESYAQSNTYSALTAT